MENYLRVENAGHVDALERGGDHKGAEVTTVHLTHFTPGNSKCVNSELSKACAPLTHLR